MRIFAVALICLMGVFAVSIDAAADRSEIVETAETYENYFELENEWFDYGVGDPYLLRYNGRYYLYPSTKDRRIGVKCWSSTDLVNWKYEGLVTEEDVTATAYAPEVVYWNGTFYMYTSPGGNGHYVLTSDSPTGPFTCQTGNFGLTIDGSVFIDDDGKWYFTHAGHDGIQGHVMDSPLEVGLGRRLNTYMGGWTEGSMIIKRNGVYYLTYCGNHVFSPGYRINYSVSKEGPLGKYSIADNNPIIISTEKEFHGLGHSSTVLGPDLDSYYICYHNLLGASAEGPPVRKMNIDRLVFNGVKMSVLGPTNFPQPVPKLPAFFTWVDEEGIGNNWDRRVEGDASWLISRLRTEHSYTAEFNFRVPASFQHDAVVGAVFDYVNPQNYAVAEVELQTSTLKLFSCREGRKVELASATLPESFDFTKLHTIRVARGDGLIRVFVDGMQKVQITSRSSAGGSIGYVYRDCTPVFSFTAFSNEANGSSDYKARNPIPGTIEAMLAGSATGPNYRLTEDGSYSVQLNDVGDRLEYNVNVKETTAYGVDFVVKAPRERAVLKVYLDGEERGSLILPAQKEHTPEWTRVRAGTVVLDKGFHILRLELTSGLAEFKYLDIYEVNTDPIDWKHSLNTKTNDLTEYGNWKWMASSDGYTVPDLDDAMAVLGDSTWQDYSIAVDVTFADRELTNDAGILVRASNISFFDHQVRDSLMGYYVAVNARQLALKKLNYDFEVLDLARVHIQPGQTYRLKVEAVDNTIRVFWEDMKKPVIEYEDPQAFTHGAVGLRSYCTSVFFQNMSVRSLQRK